PACPTRCWRGSATGSSTRSKASTGSCSTSHRSRPARSSGSSTGSAADPRVKVLVVGSGAREHSLVWKCVQSDLVERVYCAPGNGGTGGMARNIPIGAADVVRLVDFAKRERLGLVVLGPGAAVAAGAEIASRPPGFSGFGPD